MDNRTIEQHAAVLAECGRPINTASTPRNRRVQPQPPIGRVIAVGLGSGKDDYLGVVLVIREEGYVVWGWNAADQIRCGAGHGFFDGHYYDFRHDANRQYTANRAWSMFAREARRYALDAEKWDVTTAALRQQEAEHVAAAESTAEQSVEQAFEQIRDEQIAGAR